MRVRRVVGKVSGGNAHTALAQLFSQDQARWLPEGQPCSWKYQRLSIRLSHQGKERGT